MKEKGKRRGAGTKTAPSRSTKKDTKKTASTAAAKKTTARKPRARSTAARVADFMTQPVYVCQPAESCAAAATKMWNGDCGSLPVVDGGGQLAGWITDRDICMALAMETTPANELSVGQVMNAPVHHCRAEDDAQVAIGLMTEKRIRRLAVVDDSDTLVGVISFVDLVRAAKARKSGGVPSVAEVFDALREVSRPHEAPAAD